VRFAALAIALLVTPLLLVGTSGRALHNGDEAIYAEMAREMADGGAWTELRWQGEPQFPRPPGVVWLLAGLRVALGVNAHPERAELAVRVPLALACAIEVALVLLLGTALFSPSIGAAAAGLLVTADLFLGYARYLESEPFLCVSVLAAFLCWERARARPRWLLAWGACLGAALMVKQLVGALPLLAIAIDRVQRDRLRVRAVWRGLAVAAVVWLPWHLLAVLSHGRAFLDSYFVANIVRRSAGPMLHTTRATFYARELWRSEGAGALVAAGAVIWQLVDGVRRRAYGSLLSSTWVLAVFAIYSAAASRYDYYLLLIYPGLALATAALLVRAPLGRALAASAVLTAAALHLPRDLGRFDGEDEVRALTAIANERRLARLYTYNTHAYAARFYSRVDVTTLLESTEDMRLAAELRQAGLPSSTLAAPDLGATLAALPGPYALLLPRARAPLVSSTPLRAFADSPHYLLLEGR
jgi:4-amino-4-deoxy-L-arabinose transferase-like glycosyltransferase